MANANSEQVSEQQQLPSTFQSAARRLFSKELILSN